MSDEFENFTRAKIAALREEADRLERLLNEFVRARRPVAQHAPSKIIGTQQPAPPQTAMAQPRRRAGSVFRKVMEAIEAAGEAGLSIDEMVAAVTREGGTIERNTLRSQLHNEKNKNRLISLGPGRFAVPKMAGKQEASDLI